MFHGSVVKLQAFECEVFDTLQISYLHNAI